VACGMVGQILTLGRLETVFVYLRKLLVREVLIHEFLPAFALDDGVGIFSDTGP
jgi:hypothetical protein